MPADRQTGYGEHLRLCRIMFAMLRDRTAFDVTKLGVEIGPFTSTTVRHYRLRSVHTVRLASS